MPRPAWRRAAACAFLLAAASAVVASPAALLAQQVAPPVDFRHGPLRVSADRRHLAHADGTPFFWLGDTAWELFHRLTREEADAYLDDRARKGFTVIQAVVLAEFDGLHVPNLNGDTPLAGDDPTRPNEAYFRHVDDVLAMAERRGMYVGLLPTWGDKWNKRWGVGPEIFTPANARAFGELLGRRYRDRQVVWILGGDRIPESEAHLAIVRAMAAGLRAGDGGTHLMTFHPMGGQSSSRFFHGDDWLAFDMFQSGHGAANVANDRMVAADRARTPTKPVIDGEPRYEDHPINWDPTLGWFDAFDVRQAAYWALLAGAAGHTYGNHDIWQFLTPRQPPISSARTPWRAALDHPGAAQMGLARRLFLSRGFLDLVPDQALLVAPVDSGAGRQRAARGADGRYAFAYTPLGRPLTVQLSRLGSATTRSVRAQWFDPRTGDSTSIGVYPASGARTFTPPGSVGRGNDWVLLLDRVAAPLRGTGERRGR